MYTFLFWNLCKKALLESLVRIALRYEVDVIILAENSMVSAKIVSALNTASKSIFQPAQRLGCDKLDLFTRFPSRLLETVLEDERLTARELTLPGAKDSILLVALHFPSKTFMDDDEQASLVPLYVDQIKQAEKAVGHSRSLVIGDFNMNPYERGLVNVTGFNAVMTTALAARGSRKVQGKEWQFFYNPMWGLFGDRTPGPPGSYYYSGTGPASYYLHIFDQVLIRPDLYQISKNVNIQILDTDESVQFLGSSGRPNRRIYSDHLPLLVRFEL